MMGKGSGGIWAAAVIGVLVVVATVPVEVWLFTGAGILIVLGIVYFKAKHAGKVSSMPTAPKEKTETNNTHPPSYSQRLATPVEPVAPTPSSSVPAKLEEYRLPPAPKGFTGATWIQSGQTVDVAGFSIPGGMIYVGTRLKTLSGENDPCLIDPSLSASKKGDYKERQMGYWPSYSKISSSARGAYLKWLEGERKDPEADIGYVFLFFYGLERRAVLDAASDASTETDRPAITAEIRRLLSIYGEKSASFRRYAGELLNWVSLIEHSTTLYEHEVPSFPRTHELPIYIRLALGQTPGGHPKCSTYGHPNCSTRPGVT